MKKLLLVCLTIAIITAALTAFFVLPAAAENERLKTERDKLRIENSVYQERITSLAAENANLRMQIEHKDQIIALHEYYNQRNKKD